MRRFPISVPGVYSRWSSWYIGWWSDETHEASAANIPTGLAVRGAQASTALPGVMLGASRSTASLGATTDDMLPALSGANV